jgi:hypothetical protein
VSSIPATYSRRDLPFSYSGAYIIRSSSIGPRYGARPFIAVIASYRSAINLPCALCREFRIEKCLSLYGGSPSTFSSMVLPTAGAALVGITPGSYAKGILTPSSSFFCFIVPFLTALIARTGGPPFMAGFSLYCDSAHLIATQPPYSSPLSRIQSSLIIVLT